jgi:hypothetical protein
VKIQESAENYLETILMLEQSKGRVRSIDIAVELGFSKPSVSVAMKQLRENGYVEMTDGNFLLLTDKGREIAQRMYERHTLLTDWLVFLGVDRKTAAADACRIEHVVSQESFEKIREHVRQEGEFPPEE